MSWNFLSTRSGCRALVIAERFKSVSYQEVLRSIAPELDDCAPNELRAARLASLRCVIRLGVERTGGCVNFSDVTQLGQPQDFARLQELASEIQPDDACNIQFTSGTTGLPKGATLSHFNILNNGYFVAPRN